MGYGDRWEAKATRAFRTGDPAVLEVYADHDRITAGAAEVMCEAAYTAWQTDTENATPRSCSPPARTPWRH